jgi:hypothetical protein
MYKRDAFNNDLPKPCEETGKKELCKGMVELPILGQTLKINFD